MYYKDKGENRMKSIQDLTWEYFLEQKVFEIFATIGFLLIGWMVVVGVPMAIGQSIGDGMDDSCSGNYLQNVDAKKCTNGDAWMEGFFYLIVAVMIILVLGSWFNSNWEKARWKAEEETQEQKLNMRRKKLRKKNK